MPGSYELCASPTPYPGQTVHADVVASASNTHPADVCIAIQWYSEADRLIQNRGRGLAIAGTREWTDYSIGSTITPHLAQAFGITARVQGLERSYVFILSDQNKPVLAIVDNSTRLTCGGIPLLCGNGRVGGEEVRVGPV